MRRKGGFAYPHRVRVRRREDYQRVYRDGVRVPARHMVVFALLRKERESGVRLGVTASRRIGGAVVRNRCKRLLRELFRLHPAALGDLSVDLVINARKGCDQASWSELRGQYMDCVGRVRRKLLARRG